MLTFGLSNAPSSFQKMMEDILYGYKFAMMYFNGGSIFLKNMKYHFRHCEKVFERNKKANITIKAA